MKKIIILLAALLLILSCGRQSPKEAAYNDSVMFSKASYGGMAEADVAAPQMFRSMADAMEEETEFSATDPNIVERKLVKRASLRIRVENLAIAESAVAGLLEKYKGYSASTNIEENSHYFSLRIPAPEYDTFLGEMNGIGRLLRRSESTEDVTLRYYDLEGRLATKKELLKTFQSYLAKAKTIEEILSVERRISELQYEIEGTGVQLRNLINTIDYATIDLTLLGPVSATPGKNTTFGEQIKEVFSGFGGFFAGVIVFILSFIIYGIPILLLLALLFWLLLGRVGLLKKLWRVLMTNKQTDQH